MPIHGDDAVTIEGQIALKRAKAIQDRIVGKWLKMLCFPTLYNSGQNQQKCLKGTFTAVKAEPCAARVPLWIILLYLNLSALNALLEHSNVRTGERLDKWLRVLVVTPNMHKIHHSRLQPKLIPTIPIFFPFGIAFLGTYTVQAEYRKLHYGLAGYDRRESQTLRGLLQGAFQPS